MGYLHINNLYRDQNILLFKECYAMEKVHGTSAHIKWEAGSLTFFSGGEKHANFVKIFDEENLKNEFRKIGQQEITVFGEAYGGKCQGMSETYGKELKFVAFDVKIGNCWLDVPKAEQIVKTLGLEFVSYIKVPTDIERLNTERDRPSQQAVRNGISTCETDGTIVNPKIMEGVVLRPLIELTKNNGERIICKHKRDEFRETKSPRPVIDPEKLKVLQDAELVAQEWVTGERLNHITSKIPDCNMEHTGMIIKTMVDDVKREGEKEIVWSKDVEKAIGKATALLFKESLKETLNK